MKISELVVKLERMKKRYGDLDVETAVGDGRKMHGGPRLMYRKVLGERERKNRFYNCWADREEQKGSAVCVL